MDQPQSWYKRKRFIIPIALIGLFALSKLDGTNSEQIIQQVQESGSPTEEISAQPNGLSDSLETLREEDNSSTTQSDLSSSLNNTPSPVSETVVTTIPAPTVKPKVETPKTVPPKPKSSCDPNYSGCVPIASDVDCASGSGNGPAYTGKTTVIGVDIYDLDRDGDGIACE